MPAQTQQRTRVPTSVQTLRARWVLAALWVVTCPGLARAQTTGFLPVIASKPIAESMGRELAPALSQQVHGPHEVRERLLQAARGTIEKAQRLVAQAEHAHLFMRRAAALKAADTATVQLAAIGARHYAPDLVARAYVAHALARLLRPPDEQGALDAFRAAVAADPTYQPDSDRIPSRAARLLQQARRQASVHPPSLAEYAVLVQLSGMSRLIWVAARPEAGKIQLALSIYDHRQRKVIHQGSAPVPRDQLTQATTSWVQEGLGDRAAQARIPVPPPRVPPTPPPPPPPPPPDEDPKAKSWYNQWWFWTIAGAVLVGAGATIAVVSSLPPERTYEVRFRF